MKYTGAWLARFALEQLDVAWVFGIPGVHTTELFDELASSPTLKPVLVTHEGGASFMADAVSRTSRHIGTLLVVPGAGLTHAMSGIAEAFLDGVPMLVLSGGVRRNKGRAYQLHDIDQQALMRPVTKAQFLASQHHDIIPMLYMAYREAMRGRPGPVYVELPVDVLLFQGESPALPAFPGFSQDLLLREEDLDAACARLEAAKHPGLFVGWGARGARAELLALADLLGAPVATTLQGLSSFPAEHAWHAGMSFGMAAAPAARKAFEDCDCLLAVGTCFSEIGTGSYSVEVPESLIHVDIDPAVFSKNYPAAVSLCGDAQPVLAALLARLRSRGHLGSGRERLKRMAGIARDKADTLRDWRKGGDPRRVNPAKLFQSLDRVLSTDAVVVADDGNHTFLTAELLPMSGRRQFISPTDFNCMGYAVPAAIGARLANPGREVVAVVGDGAYLMTGTELLTAVAQKLGLVVLVFSDGELSQIAQAQQVPYNRKTCTVLNPLDLAASAATTGAAFLAINTDAEIEPTLAEARELAAQGRPVLVDVRIDYSRKSAFTAGIVRANLKRMPGGEKLRIVSRALVRHLGNPATAASESSS
ncbi:MAG: thiamine pyrophosphate-binding protein [Stagnimonas sp.]|nr:thiamine pyrophosphate-binding protein [Stagnimonas sp.]